MGERGGARTGRDGPFEAHVSDAVESTAAAAIEELHALRQEAQLRAAQQGVVTQLSQEMVATDDLDAMLTQVCATLAGVLDVDWCHILELSSDGRTLTRRAGVGWGPGCERDDSTVANTPASQAGRALARDTPVVDPDVAGSAPSGGTEGAGTGSRMSVRIPQRQDGPYGVLTLGSTRTGVFGDDDAAFLQSVANLVGAAVDRQLAAAELERLSLYDGLTGLPNRTLLMDRLTQALRRTRGAPGRVAVIFLDLDRLKLVNDALGHVAGDELLAAFARRLSEAVRAGDTAGRLGGDEFVVVCEGLSGDVPAATATSLELAERLNQALSGHYRLADGGVYVTPSIGVAVNARGDDAQSILHNADAAMYRAKHRGRGSIDAYDEGMRREATGRRELLEALRLAEHHDELFLLWQPIMALATGRVIAVEAFLRWRHPSLGVLAAERFLGPAEETGLIVPVGDWVLRRACEEAAALPRQGAHPPPAVAVNLSPRQLLQAELLEVVGDALQRSALPPDRLILEVAESTICHDPARVARMLGELRARGVRVAVDDVGTGDASLRRLSTVPCDLLKIDRAVLTAATGGGRERALLAAVIAAAEALELGCVGEGVETPAELETLRALGCAAGQGVLWSPPLAVGELAAWLADGARAATR